MLVAATMELEAGTDPVPSQLSGEPFSLTPTPDPDDPETRKAWAAWALLRETEAFNNLLADGGRPTHNPAELRFHDPDETTNPSVPILPWYSWGTAWHWQLHGQQGAWEDFRQTQENMRAYYTERGGLEQYEQRVSKYLKEKGLGGAVCLHSAKRQQSRLNNWKELQFIY